MTQPDDIPVMGPVEDAPHPPDHEEFDDIDPQPVLNTDVLDDYADVKEGEDIGDVDLDGDDEMGSDVESVGDVAESDDSGDTDE